MTSPRLLLLLVILTSLLISCHEDKTTTSPTHPNVIIILADDQGWGDLSIHGNKDINTPHIDQLALRGASFDRFYVQPVCSPTRAELLTGRYHLRSGVRSTSAGGERIDLDEQLISEVFHDNGYRTACFGKWHSGGQHPYHPNSRGFDRYYGFTSGHWGHYFSPPLDQNGTMVEGQGYLPDDLTDHALSFIKAKEDPFFVFLAYNTPHSPMQVPDEYWERHKDKVIKAAPDDSISQNHARAALSMVENLDHNVGRIMSQLEQEGQLESTIILYLTDNGPNGVRWNGNMKGRKGSTDEGGVRSPLFVNWKNHIAHGLRIPHIGSVIDIAPTLIDLCYLTPTKDISYDGSSLATLLLEQESVWPDRHIVHYWRDKLSVRTQQYKLDHNEALFDMISDPNQQMDISETNKPTLEYLLSLKDNWKKEVRTELPEEDLRKFPIGLKPNAWDHLPARDGISHGAIKRSNRYPNDSYFTNWTKTTDSITWDLDILEAGTYNVSLHYTADIDQVGSDLQLKIGDASLTFSMDEPHDPPLIGMDQDRVPRIESYVKDFKEVMVGQIKLSKNQDKAVLKALNIVGPSTIEINRISFLRV